MPITWDATNTMQMLLLVIAEADIKPSTSTWTKVASKLGDITPSAVRYDLGGWTTLRAFAAQHFNLLKSWPQIFLAHIEFFCLQSPGHLLTLCSQKFYKLKRECEQLKAGDGTAGPSTPKAKANGAAKTPGTGRGRKRKDAGDEDVGRTAKRPKRPAVGVAEEEPEEDEAQDVKTEEQGDADEVAD
jgi:hypothetical protein